MTSSEFLCVRCGAHMRTCCQTSEIFTTLGDVARIETHTGMQDFTEFRPAENPAYLDQDDDPLWRDAVFRPDGTRRVLKKQPTGDCTFLGPQGCVLPLEVRPLVCRIYPFDYAAEGIQPDLAPGCPLELLTNGQSLLDELGMQLEDARRWHAQLYAELKQELAHT